MPRLSLALAVAVLGASQLTACGSDPAPQDCASLAATPAAAKRCTAKVGDLVEVALSEFLPTQPSLGYGEVYYKLGRYKFGKDSVNKRFADWCEANGQVDAKSATATSTIKDASTFTCQLAVGAETQTSTDLMKTAVIGPGGKTYLTDGHHTFTSFMETADGGPTVKVRVRIQGNLSNLDGAAFWAEMEKQQWTWLRDTNDAVITPDKLPTSLGLSNFANDEYRAVLYFARDIGYEQRASNATFLEFYWGRWLRAHPSIKLANYNLKDLTSYISLVKTLSQAQAALTDASVVSDGKTATQLGKLSAWNAGAAETAGEFAKLSQPYSASKPGKLSYMLEYAKTLP